MAAALPILAVAMSAGGQIVQGVEAKNAAYAQAKVDDENARLSILGGEQDAWSSRLEERRVTGELIAGQGGSGVEMGSGTAADLIAENAYQRELEILGVRTKAVRQANNYIQAGNDRRKAGRSAMTQALFGAVSGALQGASNLRAQRISASTGAAVRAAEAVPRMKVSG
jgi:hypothetical protein